MLKTAPSWFVEQLRVGHKKTEGCGEQPSWKQRILLWVIKRFIMFSAADGSDTGPRSVQMFIINPVVCSLHERDNDRPGNAENTIIHALSVQPEFEDNTCWLLRCLSVLQLTH